MIGLLQRVSQASVVVDDVTIAAMEDGLVVLVGIERGDGQAQAARLLDRLLAYRVFADGAGRMNHDVREAGGSLLLVPQFTLAADTCKGNRPGFSRAAEAGAGRALFEHLVELGQTSPVPVLAGRFGATMQVNLSNEGPVTFWLRVSPATA